MVICLDRLLHIATNTIMSSFTKLDMPLASFSRSAVVRANINQFSHRPFLQCDVVFGSPRSGCSGTGICKIADGGGLGAVMLKKTCRLAPALFTADGNTLTMTFSREFLCPHLLKHHFRHGFLKVEDTCLMPEHIATQLGLSHNAILPGQYQVAELNGGYRIIFPL